jgi:hypothetical protein
VVLNSQTYPESLKRALEEAHHDHLQVPSASARNSQQEPRSSVSLPEHIAKKRRTSTEIHSSRLPPTDSSKRGPVTYGKGSKSIFSSSLAHLANNETELPAANNSPEHALEAFLGLEGTIRADYGEHDPMALFPEPSSTVPNATFTQQRVLEGVVAPVMIGLDSDAYVDGPHDQVPPKASVPWSDMMNFSPVEAGEQSEPFDPQSELPPLPPLPPLPEPTQDSIISQRSRRASSVRARGSPLQHEILLDSVVATGAVDAPGEKDASLTPHLLPSGFEDFQEDKTENNRKPSQKLKIKLSSVQPPKDDFSVIGLPQDQYKPRPSRSRSLQVDSSAPIDYSIRPEKAAKNAKRRKTTTVAAATRSTQAVDTTATPEKVRRICDMGFTPTSTGRALKHHNGDVTQTIDWLINNGMGEDELAPRKLPKRKVASKAPNLDRLGTAAGPETTAEPSTEAMDSKIEDTQPSKPSDVATCTPTKATARSDAMAATEITTTAKSDELQTPTVQVVIPSKSPRAIPPHTLDSANTSSKRAKRRKTTLDVPEPESALEIPAVPEKTTQTKGRGRPRKVANVTSSTEKVENVSPETQEQQEHELNGALETIKPNPPASIDPLAPGTHSSEDAQNLPPMPSNLSNDPSPPVPARTPEQTIKPASRSPGSKGKASYRVGLSRRARVAPLLRIVKK